MKFCAVCDMATGSYHLESCSRAGRVQPTDPLVEKLDSKPLDPFRMCGHCGIHLDLPSDGCETGYHPLAPADPAIGQPGYAASRRAKRPAPVGEALLAVIRALEPYHPDVRARLVAGALAFLREA